MALKHRPADPELVVRSMPQPRADVPKVDLRPDLSDLPVLEPDVDAPEPAHRWVSRPALARMVQLFVLAVPILASLLVAAVLSATLPRADRLSIALLWWAVVVLGSTVTLFAVDRVARRLLPLALLLRLSLLFPDQAPRRFRVAATAWSSRRLREQIERARVTGVSDAPVEAATQIIRLLASLAVHDRRTRGHCERVRAYNDLLAEELGLPPADRDRLRWAALIHDIGKLKVSPRLLNKPGLPTAREWDVLRAHPLRGAEIAAPLAEWLGPWAAAIEQHHEHWDGTGYPHGLAETEISLGARIVAVADAFEVMTSPRPYSRPVNADAARAELATCAGTHFDPMVVRAFLNISLGRLRKAMGPIAWLTQVPILAGMPRLEAAIIQGGRHAATASVAGAGAVGVVAVTTLAPHGHSTPGSHHHHGPATLSADAAPGPDTLAPHPAPVTATAAQEPATRPRHRATDSHHRDAKPRVQAERHQRAPQREDHAGTADTTRKTRHRAATPDVTAPVDSNESKGRCSGNSGKGIGNGGPREAAPGERRTWSDGATAAHKRARGLRACD